MKNVMRITSSTGGFNLLSITEQKNSSKSITVLKRHRQTRGKMTCTTSQELVDLEENTRTLFLPIVNSSLTMCTWHNSKGSIRHELLQTKHSIPNGTYLNSGIMVQVQEVIR